MGLNARGRNAGILLIVAMAAAFIAAQMLGCGSKSSPHTSRGNSLANEQAQFRHEALHSAITLLNMPEQMDDDEKASEQIVDSLNQWRRLTREAEKSAATDDGASSASKSDDEKTDDREPSGKLSNPLIEALPDKLKSTRWVRRLNNEIFDPQYDGTFLREAALLRDVASHAAGESHDDLARAEALFDWTVRNIQLEPQPLADSSPEEQWLARHLPIETVFYGRGTWRQRAWVFMLLARQAGLDVVLLAIPDPNNPQQPRAWLTALVSGGELYLFDPNYGLPIPGPGGKGIATLSQAAENEAILRQMDVAGGQTYPRKSGDIQKVVALVDGTPGYLEPRMKLLESQLKGRDRIVLSADAAALAEKLRGTKHVDRVMLWSMPLETLAQRSPTLPEQLAPEIVGASRAEKDPFRFLYLPEATSRQSEDPRRQPRPILALRLARLLELRGALGGGSAASTADDPKSKASELVEHGAKYFFIRSIDTKDELDRLRQLAESHSDVLGRPVTKDEVDARQHKNDNAAYWLGIVLFEQKTFDPARQYFERTLNATGANSWTNGARYNLARCYEALGQFPKAIELYEADRSPQRNGNHLRAARLKEKQPVDRPQNGKQK